MNIVFDNFKQNFVLPLAGARLRTPYLSSGRELSFTSGEEALPFFSTVLARLDLTLPALSS